MPLPLTNIKLEELFMTASYEHAVSKLVGAEYLLFLMYI